MKKIIIILFSIIFISCCSSDISREKPSTMVGRILVVGNEPFTKYALHTDDKQVYKINCEKELETLFEKNQGNIFKTTVIKLEENPDGKFITVIKAEKVNTK